MTWYCSRYGVVGYYPFGGVPTLVDPRTTPHDATLTNVHEQSHRDLANNTLYGYLLSRLHELAELPEARASRPQDAMADLSMRIFKCAEGSATAIELIAGGHRNPDSTAAQQVAGLPPDYIQAVGLFRPLIDRKTPLPPPLDLLLRLSIVTGVAEVAADWNVLTGPRLPRDFRQLQSRLLDWAGPDTVLEDLLRVAAGIPNEHYIAALDAARRTAPAADFLRLARQNIRAIKTLILYHKGIDPSQAPLLEDASRLAANTLLDRSLTERFPMLPRHAWSSDQVFDSEVSVDVKEPPFLLTDLDVSAAELPARTRELAQQEDFFSFVANVQRNPATGSYALYLRPVSMANRVIDLAQPYLVCQSVSAEDLRSLDVAGYRLVWLAFGIPYPGAAFYDAEFMLSLKQPLYLHFPEFGWDRLRQIAATLPGAQELMLYDLPAEVGLSVASWKVGRVTMFGLTPPQFGGPTPGPAATHGEIGSNSEFAAVIVAVIRTSRR